MYILLSYRVVSYFCVLFKSGENWATVNPRYFQAFWIQKQNWINQKIIYIYFFITIDSKYRRAMLRILFFNLALSIMSHYITDNLFNRISSVSLLDNNNSFRKWFFSYMCFFRIVTFSDVWHLFYLVLGGTIYLLHFALLRNHFPHFFSFLQLISNLTFYQSFKET